MLKTFTESQMPEIQSIVLGYIKTQVLDDLYKLIESKNTLRSIEFQLENEFIPLSFWRRIIETVFYAKTTIIMHRYLVVCIRRESG